MKCKVTRKLRPVRLTDPGAAQRNTISENVHRLKERLLNEQLHQVSDPELRRGLELAANESTALAWNTAYPLLLLPELMAERRRFTEVRHSRQTGIRERSRPKLSIAA